MGGVEFVFVGEIGLVGFGVEVGFGAVVVGKINEYWFRYCLLLENPMIEVYAAIIVARISKIAH